MWSTPIEFESTRVSFVNLMSKSPLEDAVIDSENTQFIPIDSGKEVFCVDDSNSAFTEENYFIMYSVRSAEVTLSLTGKVFLLHAGSLSKSPSASQKAGEIFFKFDVFKLFVLF